MEGEGDRRITGIAQMPRLFKRCLAIINTRSGSRDGRSIFASALQQYLDRAGIPHRDVHVPEQDTVEAVYSAIKESECIVVCGGDGTVSSVVNVLATAAQAELIDLIGSRDQEGATVPAPNWTSTLSSSASSTATVPLPLCRPLLIVPAGMQNSIAHSLGIQSAERSVSAFVMGRQEPVPLWEVRLNGVLVRYVCSYVAVGSYAEVVRRFHALDAVGDEYVALPMLTSKFSAAALYTCMRAETFACSVTLTTKPHTGVGSGGAEVVWNAGDGTSTPPPPLYSSPIRMLLAAQMPLQHSSYSLCPDASFKAGTLAATVATAEASRLRMWHLFRREAAEGYVLNEDGVHTHQQLTRLCVRVTGSTSQGASAATDSAPPDGDGKVAADQTETQVLASLDGEMLHLPPGSELTVHRAPFDLPFLIC